MKFKQILWLVVSLLVLLSACNDSKSTPAVGSSDDNVTYFDGNDQVMNKAIETAKQNFEQFEQAFVANQKSDKYTDFAIKEGFPTKDGGVEHMWVGDLTFDGKVFTGTLNNKPVMDVSVKQGDKITIDKNRLSDWMYLSNETNQLFGGYTIRVIRDAMSADEQKQFDQESGFNFAP